jgi:hypothetical protein
LGKHDAYRYALGDDGSRTGLWDGGHGEETLTPEQ